jgi:hypothetical protein
MLDNASKLVFERYEFWSLLRKINKDYEAQYTGYYEPTRQGHSDSFDKWLVEQYGLQIYFDHTGNILGDYTIVDEGKYAWMILKYK